MESSEYNWANISETICPEMLVFGKQAFWMFLFSEYPIISQINTLLLPYLISYYSSAFTINQFHNHDADVYAPQRLFNTYTQYSAPELLPIPEGTRVPSLDVHRISLLALERFCTPSYTSCHQTFLLFTKTAVSSSSMEACQHFTNSQRISTVIVCPDSTDIPYAHLRGQSANKRFSWSSGP